MAFREGRCGEGTAPLRWGVKDAERGCNDSKGELLARSRRDAFQLRCYRVFCTAKCWKKQGYVPLANGPAANGHIRKLCKEC
jgi:hypothetical protein